MVYEENEDVQIHPSRSEVTTFVTADLIDEKKPELVACLKQNYDVFAWSTHELLVQNAEPDVTWKIFVNGSSTLQGSRIRILLILPREDRMQLSVRIDYRATNNEAEYKVLIAGLQAARHVGATRVLIYSDSQLAAQQLLSTFEKSNALLKLYAEVFEKLKADFQEMIIQKIP
ncbi:uncharacterized protein LOC122010656 [Zingiber officinale]|uniref:uncharacterized protein LOC122010656 n=1 Tax=Zingiber officinale TaxID=94328 RepID=UPI001C4D83B5|nr:uncharacterized protein LOC122010656 [Zingiber officinale]